MSGKNQFVGEKRLSRYEAQLFSYARARTEVHPNRVFNKMDQAQIIVDQDLWGPQTYGTDVAAQAQAADTVVRQKLIDVFCPPETEIKSRWLADNGLTHMGPIFEYLGWLFYTGMAGSHRVVIKTDFGYVWLIANPRHTDKGDICDFGFLATNTQIVDHLMTHTFGLVPVGE